MVWILGILCVFLLLANLDLKARVRRLERLLCKKCQDRLIKLEREAQREIDKDWDDDQSQG